MFNLRSVFAFWAIVALFLGSVGRAQAQTTGGITVTIPMTGVKRAHQDYAGKVLVTQINYKDCLNEDTFTFTVNLGTGYAAYALEAWAGTGCETQANRIGTARTCWQLATLQPTSIIVNNLQVPVRALLSGRTGGQSLGTGGTGGTDATGGTGGTDATVGGGETGGTDSGGAANVPSGTPPECTPTSKVTAPQTLVLYFMLIDSNGVVGGQAQYKVTFKLLAPNPPSNVMSGTGEEIAPISWTPIAMNADQTVDGYQLYCDPPPGLDAANESGIDWDPNILPVTCPDSDVLVAGARPDDKYKCGTANKTSSRANATGLVNMVPYRVSVAATDTYRNVGTVSAPAACAIPQPVTGFFEAYRDAGGEGGGGFCSFSRHGRPVLLVTLSGLGLLLVLRRRRAT